MTRMTSRRGGRRGDGRTDGDAARRHLLAGTPVTERRLSLAGVSTTVLEAGSGPPVVLLHGGIECGGVYWAPVVSRLAEDHRLVIPDVPGLGESEPVDRLGDDVFADWFAALLRATGAERPALVAHSLLGTMGARFAARHGDLLGRLVVYAGPGVGPYRMPAGLLVTAIRFGLSPSERNLYRFTRWAFLDVDRAREQDPGWMDAFSTYTRARSRVPHVKRTMRGLIRDCTKRIPAGELGRIEVPTALLWGRHDRMVPLRIGAAARDEVGWPLHVIEHAAHVPHIEQTGAFLAALGPTLGHRRSQGVDVTPG